MELAMKDALNTLKVLAEESRLRIFMTLHGQELCVCQIVALLGLFPRAQRSGAVARAEA